MHANVSESKVTANGAAPGAGLAASGVQIIAEGRVTNTAPTAASAVFVTASFRSANGTLASASVGPVAIAAGADHAFKIVAKPSQPTQLWSVARPFLYTATIEVRIGGHDAAAGQSTTACNKLPRSVWLSAPLVARRPSRLWNPRNAFLVCFSIRLLLPRLPFQG